MKIKLHDYQIDARNWVIQNPAAGLFLPPGLGKTLIMLSTIKILIDAGVITNVLIIAPLRVVYMVWPKEIEKWEFDFSVGILHGKDKDKIITQKNTINIINPEGLQWLHAKHLNKLNNKTMLICDESTLFKSHSSIRFKLLKQMLKIFPRRVILTGTPAPNGLLQLWSQIYILDHGNRLGAGITKYRQRWFMPSFNGFSWIMRDGADKYIYEAINDIVMHKSLNELDLPDKIHNVISVSLPKEVSDMYKQMKTEFITEHTVDGELTQIAAVNAAAQGSKLKQIANGVIYGENKLHLHLHDQKIKACDELVESLAGRPLLVVYEHLHELAILQAYFNAPNIGGGIAGKELDRIVNKWNKGDIPVLLIQPQAAGHGLNLQDGGCCDVCWYSITFDLELYEQVNARVYRQGVKNNVTIHHIVAEKTIDQHIMTVLEGKTALQDALLTSLLK